MGIPFRFTIPDDEPFAPLTLEDCHARLAPKTGRDVGKETGGDAGRGANPGALSIDSKLSIMRHQAQLWIEAGALSEALDGLEAAIALKPDDPFTHAYKGLVLEQLGKRKDAKAMYQFALSHLSDPNHPIAAQLWYRYGNVLRTQGRHKQALEKLDRAIALQPNYAEALSGRAVVLALLGRHKQAKQESDRALALAPESPLILNNGGIVLMAARKYKLALVQFQAVSREDPDFDRAWYNQGLALMRLGQNDEALACLERALKNYSLVNSEANRETSSEANLETKPKTKPKTKASSQRFQAFRQRLLTINKTDHPWLISAWTLHAFLSLKKRRLEDAIASSREAQVLDPDNYSAALYKVTALVGTGQFWPQLKTKAGRQDMGHDVRMIVKGLRYRFLGLFILIGIFLWGEGSVFDGIRQYLPLVLSFAIIFLVGMDLWRHKSRLRFVWTVYFGNGFLGALLTYVRAVLILVATLFTFTLTYEHAPTFMRWGWANVVFGASGNIIFQPLNMLQELSLHTPLHNGIVGNLMQSPMMNGVHSLLAASPLSSGGILAGLGASLGTSWGMLSFLGVSSALAVLGAPLFHIGDFHVTIASILTLLFWLALIMGVPFWANLEEKIFRQGANSWSSITVRSIQFGLIHLLAGIPILGGFVLILPGFLFACRYKYVRDRHYRRYHDSHEADAAGVLASTADHAVYNAILMTIAIATILFEQMTSL